MRIPTLFSATATGTAVAADLTGDGRADLVE
jgi:hypothetical protein